MKGGIVVISGPSGSGKTSLAKRTCEVLNGRAYFSISSTTREMRKGEQDGVDYHFLSRTEFSNDIDQGYFLEWAEVHGNFYGTSLKTIEKMLREDKIVFLDIDIQGFNSIKKVYPDIITSVFITTKNISLLKERLGVRGSETEDAFQTRIMNALSEMNKIDGYDFLLVNDDFEESLEKLIAIAKVSLLRESKVNIEKFIEQWKKG